MNVLFNMDDACTKMIGVKENGKSPDWMIPLGISRMGS